MLSRTLHLPLSNNFFLFGPRQTGKTSLIKERFDKDKILHINLLLSTEYAKFIVDPSRIRSEIMALNDSTSHVFIDEVQRIPEILNEVQALLDEGVKQKFILTGSSARKLKKNNANMLGGRALTYHLFPFTQKELGERFNLNEVLSYGTLPPVVMENNLEIKKEILRSYVEIYLDQEIKAEALSRNIGGFLRFLTVAAQMNGEQINYSNIAKDVGITSVTIKEYYQILEDTLIGRFLYSFSSSERKSLKVSPKFYLFDTGVIRALLNQLSIDPSLTPYEYGKHFESWFINQVFAISDYYRKDWKLSFLRTKNDVEVDLIIETPYGKTIALEVKSKKWPVDEDYRSGFNALLKLRKDAKLVCVCNGDRARKEADIEILPVIDALRWLETL